MPVGASEIAILLKAQDAASSVIGNVSKELDTLSATGQKTQTSLMGIGSALNGAALMGIAAGAVALGAGLTGAVSAASNFEKGLSGIAAVSGASAAQMDAIRQTALQLGKDTAFSAQEAAAGMEELIKAGQPLEAVLNGGAAAALNLAAATGTEVPRAAEVMATAMNVFKSEGLEASHVADTFTQIANASSTSVHELGYSFASVATVARTVGLSFDDTALALAVLAEQGLKGSDAGTSLKAMLNQLSPSTKKATEVMRELGIITADGKNQFFDATGSAKSYAEIAELLKTSLAGLTDEEKNKALTQMFGTDGQRAASAAMRDGAAGAAHMAQMMADSGDAAQSARTRLNNLAGSMEALKGSLETGAIILGGMLTPALKGFTDQAIVVVNQGIGILEQLPDAWRTIGQAFEGAWEPSDSLTPFMNAVGNAGIQLKATLGPAIATIGPMLSAAFEWIQANGDAIIGAISGIGVAFAGLMAASAVVSIITGIAAALAVLLSPIGLLIVAAGLLGAAWATNFGDIQGRVAAFAAIVQQALGGDVEGAFSALADLVTATGTEIAEAVKTWGTAFVEWVKVAGPPMLAALTVVIGQLFSWVTAQSGPLMAQLLTWATAFIQWVGPMMPLLWTALGQVIVALGNWIQANGPTILAALAAWATAFVEWVGPAAAALLVALVELQVAMITWIATTALPAIAAQLLIWGTAFVEWIAPATEQMLAGLEAMLAGLAGWLAGAALAAITAGVMFWLQPFVDWTVQTSTILTDWGTAAVGLVTTALALIQTAIEAGQALWATIWQTGWDALATIATAFWALLTPETQAKLTELQTQFTVFWGLVQTLWTTATAALTTLITTWWTEIVTLFTTQTAALTALITTWWTEQTALWTTQTAAVTTVTTTWWTELVALFATQTAAILAALATWWAALVAQATEMMAAITAAITAALEPWIALFQTTLDGIGTAITGAGATLGGAAATLGTQIVDMMVAAVNAKVGEIASALTAGVQKAIDAAKLLLSSFKPSVGGGGGGGSSNSAQYKALIDKVAKEENEDPALIAALMDAEQSGAGSTSSAGAKGLMQTLPNYWKPGEDPHDPETSIRQGVRAIKDKRAILGPNAKPQDIADRYLGAPDAGYRQLFNESYARNQQRSQEGPGGPPSIGAIVPGGQGQFSQGGTHQGGPAADIFAPTGSPIFAPSGGVIMDASNSLGGNAAVMKGDDGKYYYMGHGNTPFVTGRVETGQQIGEVGNTGNARGTSPHLHLAVGDDPSVFDRTGGQGNMTLPKMLPGEDRPPMEWGTDDESMYPNLTGMVEQTKPALDAWTEMTTGISDRSEDMKKQTLTSVTDLGNGTMTMTQDAAGNTIATITDLNGQVTSQYATMANGAQMSMDGLSQGTLTSVNDMGTGIITTMQDASGNMIATVTDTNGQVTAQYTAMAASATTEASNLATGVNTAMTGVGDMTEAEMNAMLATVQTTTATAAAEGSASFLGLSSDATTSMGTLATNVSASGELMSTNVVTAAQEAWQVASTALEALNTDGTTSIGALETDGSKSADELATNVTESTDDLHTDGAENIEGFKDDATQSMDGAQQDASQSADEMYSNVAGSTANLASDGVGNVETFESGSTEAMGTAQTSASTAAELMKSGVLEATAAVASDGAASVQEFAGAAETGFGEAGEAAKTAATDMEAVGQVEIAAPDVGDVVDAMEDVEKAAKKAEQAVAKVGGHGGEEGGKDEDSPYGKNSVSNSAMTRLTAMAQTFVAQAEATGEAVASGATVAAEAVASGAAVTAEALTATAETTTRAVLSSTQALADTATKATTAAARAVSRTSSALPAKATNSVFLMIDFAGTSGAEGRWWEALLPGLQKFEDTLNKVLDMLADFEDLAEIGLTAFADSVSDTFADVSLSVNGVIADLKAAFTVHKTFLDEFSVRIKGVFVTAGKDIQAFSKTTIQEFKATEKGVRDLFAVMKLVGSSAEELLKVFPWLKPPKPTTPPTPPGPPEPPPEPPFHVEPGDPTERPTPPPPPGEAPISTIPVVDERVDYDRLAASIVNALSGANNQYIMNITTTAPVEPLARDFAILEAQSRSVT